MVEKREIWTASDGKEFPSKSEAEAHEKEIKDPNYKKEQKIQDLANKILSLEMQIMNLSNRIEILEHPFGQLNKRQPYIWNQDPVPNVQPYNNTNRVWYGTGENLSEALNNLKEVK